ncbi:LysR family transcriptional regulator [Pyxidicoccus fallax]|uniref:LysR family transcriptional regulator n=1 Tax=Pyxidicoccus fallax TaxID=394095 RepID=A0A848LF32_9BACT|nr:LysR family transcriptional regulator [Pyxidicoccus fallax]NMO17034.1 LysR family transcriptional regulator [Pyxidicoccus fallax]NPC82484.1 LysR family transcriptional regulator [Pyxidicoccus fallax]
MDLDPRYLEAFFTVCREGGFSRAAAVMHRTQPAISYQVRMLERQLGTRLIERAQRPLLLTPAGKRLRELCERFFGEFGRLAASFAEGAPLTEEPLHIAAVSGFGRYVLFPLLCQPPFSRLRYSLRFPTVDEVFRTLEEGRCDLGIVYVPRVSRLLRVQPLRREELVLIAPPGFDASAHAPRSVKGYETLPFITYDECEYVFGRWFDAHFGTQPAGMREVCHFEELEEVLETVALGRGVSVIPDHVAAQAVQQGRVKLLRPTSRRATNAIYSVTRAGAAHHPDVERLIEALRAERPTPSAPKKTSVGTRPSSRSRGTSGRRRA